MARENVKFSDPNLTGDGTYYYSLIDNSQVLQAKVDDGSVAFTYPLDTSVGNEVKALEWDGVYFWSLEPKSGGFIIRKWAIQSFICKQQQKFEFSDGGSHTYDADAMAVEHYRLTVGDNDNGSGGYTLGLSSIQISDTSMLSSGDVLTFVRKRTSAASRSGTSFVEQAVVQTVDSGTQVTVTSAMSGDPYGDGKGFRGPSASSGGSEPTPPDLVYVTKNLWIANKHSPGDPSTPALYKVNAANGSNLTQYSGTQYDGVGGCTFYTKYDRAGSDPNKYNTTIDVDSDLGGKQTYLLIARSSVLLFFNVNTNVVDRSLVMNNVQTDTVTTWSVYDMYVGGEEPDIVLFRLQDGTTYKDESLVEQDESWSENNYEKQLLRRVVSSIAVVAEPSIIPADGVSTATVTAVLRDQYNDLIPSGKQVNWSDDSGENRVSPTQSATNDFGEASTTYTAGTTEQDVKITAGVTNGLV